MARYYKKTIEEITDARAVRKKRFEMNHAKLTRYFGKDIASISLCLYPVELWGYVDVPMLHYQLKLKHKDRIPFSVNGFCRWVYRRYGEDAFYFLSRSITTWQSIHISKKEYEGKTEKHIKRKLRRKDDGQW
jgi:hypothetical protein